MTFVLPGNHHAEVDFLGYKRRSVVLLSLSEAVARLLVKHGEPRLTRAPCLRLGVYKGSPMALVAEESPDTAALLPSPLGPLLRSSVLGGSLRQTGRPPTQALW